MTGPDESPPLTDHATLTAAALARMRGVSDDCVPQTAIDAWLAKSPQEQQLLSLLDVGVTRAYRLDTDDERTVPLGINIVLQQVASNPRGGEHAKKSHGSKPWRWTYGLVVAFSAFCVVLGVREIASNRGHTRMYATRAEQFATVTFPNGNHVTLAPQTTLVVHDGVRGHAARVLTLNGDVYVAIAHNDRAPIQVRAGGITAHVLGTAFDIRRYSGDRTTSVTVMEGKVMVTNSSIAPAILTDGMTALAGDSTTQVYTTRGPAEVQQWTMGNLAFHNAPVPEVLNTLGHWYGVEFRLADSTLVRERVTAVFDGAPITDVMIALRSLLNVTTTMSSGPRVVVTLRPQTARSSGTIRRAVDGLFPESKEVGR